MSSSGMTVFIEPNAAVKSNNELKELYSREKNEIERILISLSVKCAEHEMDILSDLKNCGHEIILVSSGAIGMGVGKLHLKSRPEDIPTKQAAAAVGQCELMYTYDRLFSEYNHTVAQLLVTGSDVEDTHRCSHFYNTLYRLLELGALPVINENDTVATDEIVIGDNDTLAAIVAESVRADLLILLSDIDGLYTADPHVDLVPGLVAHFRPAAFGRGEQAGLLPPGVGGMGLDRRGEQGDVRALRRGVPAGHHRVEPRRVGRNIVQKGERKEEKTADGKNSGRDDDDRQYESDDAP